MNDAIPYRYLPPADNDRFRVFRQGSVVDPRGRVDTRPYEAGGRRRARGYAPLQGGRSSAGAWIRAPTRLVIVGGRVDTRPYKQQSSAGFSPPGSWGRVPIDPPRSDAQRWNAAVFLLFRFERGPERVSSR